MVVGSKSNETWNHRKKHSGRASRLRIGALLSVGALVAGTCVSVMGAGVASAKSTTHPTINVGFITSLTGPIASLIDTTARGFEARIALQNAEGGIHGSKIKLFVKDDALSTTQVLTDVQDLVTQDHVVAIGDFSAVLGAAEPYLIAHGVPVVGVNYGGTTDWEPPQTIFFPIAESSGSNSLAPAAWGLFFKQQGATNVAAFANATGVAPAIAKQVQTSALAAGLKSTYLNITVPPSQTGGFDTYVETMMSDGVDGIVSNMSGTQNLALLEAAEQAGLVEENR